MRFGNALIDSHQVMRDAHVRRGMHVADFGCGRTGHIILPAAEAVEEDGRVYAVDLSRDHLQMINNLASMRGMSHVYPVWGDYERMGRVQISPSSLDVIFFVNNLPLISS